MEKIISASFIITPEWGCFHSNGGTPATIIHSKKKQYQPSISGIPAMENSIELPPSGQTNLAISARVEVAV